MKKKTSIQKTKGGELIYKCRKCGEVYQNTHVPDLHMVMIAIQDDWDKPNIFNEKRHWLKEFNNNNIYDIHFCDEKNFGIADLVGGILD